MNKSKRGVFFSADAFIALLIILFVLLIVFVTKEETRHESDVHQDVLDVLSKLKVGEVNNDYVLSLISSGQITNLNNSLLEQIGEFYVTDVATASNLASEVLRNVNVSENFGIWYGATLIYSKNSSAYENARDVDTARKLLSGISEGESVTGYSARAFLSSSQLSKYFYFGGYVGDGNISFLVDYSGNITSAEIEAAVNDDFNLYVNGNLAGNFGGSSSDLNPVNYSVPINNFVSGVNTVELRGNNLYVAGGFFKINYLADVSYAQPEKYFFPGITGAVNLYDGFYVPGDLQQLSIFLHLNSSERAFLNIGNVTVFNGTTNGEQEITISNAALSSILDYDFLSRKTVPLRLGLENVSFTGISEAVDVFSVTDLSGSMGGQKIQDARNANNQLIDSILNFSENRVGLAGYETWAKKSSYHTLSNDSVSLENEVNSWDANGYTCICCGIMKAISCFDTSIFDDNFNGQSLGSNPIGWSLSEGNGAVNIVSGLEGDKAANVARLSSQNPTVNHYFSPQDEKISFEFLARHNSGNGRVRIEIEGATSGFGASFEDYIILKMYNGWIRNNNAQVTQYSLNTIYKIKIEVLPNANTFDLYVDEQLVGNDLPVYSTRNNVARVSFTTENANVNYDFDDVKVFLADEICDVQGQRNRVAIVMSDGFANRACGLDPVQDYNNDGDTTDDPTDHAIEAACIAKQQYDITVHAVGFGNGADEEALQRVAACGNGSYYFADVGELSQLYQQIAEDIVASYAEQTLEFSGDLNTRVYPDSYISFIYNGTANPFGLIFTLESQFQGDSSGIFSVPSDAQVLEAGVTSYSGPRWTQNVKLNNGSVYNLSSYGNNYISLGDPFIVNLPVSSLNAGDNFVSLTTGSSPQNSSAGSASNKIIYTLSKNSTAFSQIVPLAAGCIWNIEFEDGSSINVTIPENYAGGDFCYYNSLNGGGQIANENDAFQLAVENLLRGLDIDLDGRVDFIFSEQDLQVSLSEVTGIPFPWSSEVQARRWF